MSLRAALRVAPCARRVASAHPTHKDQRLYDHLTGQVVRRWQSGGADAKGSKLLPPSVLFGKKPEASQQRDPDSSSSITEKHRATTRELLRVVTPAKEEEEEEEEEEESEQTSMEASRSLGPNESARELFAEAMNFRPDEPDPDYHSKPLPEFMEKHGSVLNMVTVDSLVNAGAHYGHHKSIWNPKMEPYLYGVREDIHIFDLEQTVAHLRRALDVLRHVAYEGGTILFVGNRMPFEKLIRYTAIGCGEFYLTEKWRGGTLSNKSSVLRSGLMPDFVVFLTLPVSKGALHECNLMNIPSIAIVDSDQDPFLVTYPIPGNDDTPSAVELYCDLMQKAVVEGKYCRSNFMNLYDSHE